MNFPVKGQRFESCGLGFIVGWGSIFFRDWDVQGRVTSIGPRGVRVQAQEPDNAHKLISL